MTTNCIVQARMGSTRLPGKVMKEIQGKPLIAYLLSRVSLCTQISQVVVAIPERDLDGPLGRFLMFRKVNISTGPEDDVAKRFAIALKSYPCDAFVRVCADSPLIQPEIIDAAANILGQGLYVLVGSAQGNIAQAFNSDFFLETEPDMKGDEREHIGMWYEKNCSTVVDTPEDFERLSCLISQQRL